MVESEGLPTSVDRPKLWIAAFVGILVLGGVLGLGWTAGQTDVVGFALAETDGDVNVTIRRLGDGESRRVYRGAHPTADGERIEVWSAERTGRYRVTLDGANATCTVRVTVQRRSGSLTVQTPPPPSACPADLRIDVRSKPV